MVIIDDLISQKEEGRISFDADENNGTITVLVNGVVKDTIADYKGRRIRVSSTGKYSLRVLDRVTNQHTDYDLKKYLEGDGNGAASKT